MSGFNIRLAYKEDILGMHEVEKASFSCPWSLESFTENFLNAYSIYVLAQTQTGEIAGFGGMQVIFDEAHIMNVAVKNDFRRKGVADGMLKLMMLEAKKRNAERIYLEVRKSNFNAQALYYKNNFKVLAIRPKYYSDNDEDAIIMIADL